MLAYFVGTAANTIPLPGATSGGLIGALVAFGLEPGVAIAAVLAYRGVAMWLPAPLGAVAASSLRRTTRAWADADERLASALTRPRRRPVRLRAAAGRSGPLGA